MSQNRYMYKGTYSAKPEFALKRAQELMDMGNKEQALETLAAIATGPKKQKIWSKKLELLVSKFCLLCVELNKPGKARDGLHNFKSVSLQNPQSVELVVKEFLDASERAIDQVKSDAFVEPLTKINLDPSLVHLIRGITVDEFTGQADKENVRPWLKFLFEAYKIALEILRNNAKLETAYKNVAKQAFEYCCKYNRVYEFKDLSKKIKTISQYIDSEEAITSHLEVKFAQLNASVTLELWSEVHGAIQEIYNTLILPSKTPISKEFLLTYYSQLEKLLWVSKSYAPHAEALLKYTELKEEQDKIYLNSTISVDLEPEAKAEREKTRQEAIQKFQKENRLLTSRIVLAALCIPLSTKQDDPYCLSYDAQKEKESRLAAFLNFEPHLNRSAILRDLSEGAFQKCEPYIVDLYKLLEVNVQPFIFAKEVSKHLEKLAETPEYKQYCSTLQSISFGKLLQKLSTVYQSMEIKQLQKLFPSFSIQEIQKHAIFARSSGEVDCVIDHRQEVINFNTVSLSSPDVRFKLSEITRNLRKCVEEIDSNKESELAKKRERIFKAIAKNIAGERQRLIERRQYIEKMKELREAEEAKNQKLANERRALAQSEAEKRAADALRKAQEASAATKAQKQKEIEEKKRNEIVQAKLKDMAQSVGTAASVKISEHLEEHFESSEEFVKRQLAQIVAERKKKEKLIEAELQAQNHMIRAIREQEVELRKKEYENSVKAAKEAFDKAIEDRVKKLEALVQQRSEAKARLTRVESDFEIFKQKIDEEKEIEFQTKKRERDAKVQHWREEKERKRRALEAEQRRREEEEEERIRNEEREREAALKREQEKITQPTPYKPSITGAVGSSRPTTVKPWEREKTDTKPGGSGPPVSSKFQSPTFGTKPESPFASKPVTTGPPSTTTPTGPSQKPSPFGDAKPVTTGPPQKPSPFGDAKPVTIGPSQKPSPFGDAKPVTIGPSQKPSPFGDAKPVTTGPSQKPSPFGDAKPVTTGPSQKPSPFGDAKPKDHPQDGEEMTNNKPWRRDDKQQTKPETGKPWEKQNQPKLSSQPQNTAKPSFSSQNPKGNAPKPWEKQGNNTEKKTNQNASSEDGWMQQRNKK